MPVPLWGADYTSQPGGSLLGVVGMFQDGPAGGASVGGGQTELFGRIALKKGLLDEDRLAQAVRYQEEIRALGLNKPLGEILIDDGVLSEEQVEMVLRLQALNERALEERRVARVLVTNGLASEGDVEAALTLTREDGYLRGVMDVLVGKGFLLPSQARAVKKALDRTAGATPGPILRPAGDGATPGPTPLSQRSTTGRLADALTVDVGTDDESRDAERRVQEALFAAVALREGRLLVPELERALRQQEQERRDGSPPTPLARVLETRGILTPADLEAIQKAMDASRAERLAIPGYQLLDVMGHGRTSIVLRARHELIEREVAIKLFRAEHMAATEAESLIDEARVIARIQHENVTGLFEVGRVHRRIYYVMELVDGPTVHELIRASGSLAEREVLRIGLDVARALGAIEEAGLVHRDVKPRNIVMAPSGQAKLTDLGLARPEGELDPNSGRAIYGTPHTIAPEQIHGDPIDIRADLYGLGATLYWMLIGQPPYDGKRPMDVMLAHATAPVPDPHASRPDVSPELAALVRRLLAKDRNHRPASAKALVEELEAMVAFSAAPPPAPPSR